MENRIKKALKEIWLILSAFGIAFALLSWAEEASFLTFGSRPLKGLIACSAGILLYFGVARIMED